MRGGAPAPEESLVEQTCARGRVLGPVQRDAEALETLEKVDTLVVDMEKEAIKLVEALVGVGSAKVRAPRMQLSEAEASRVEELMANAEPEAFDLEGLAKQTAGYTGAEIERVVKTALRAAFADGGREMDTSDLEMAVKATVPLSTTMTEQIEAMRAWASRARPASSAWVRLSWGLRASCRRSRPWRCSYS